ncbi:uncharacterized protein KRP23_2613 [Phytophthora ramorum]|uniref:uncharacterized protein n=1 Tax=Phytophthora ramorum TaxID=164328 RepID=UPI0030B0F462|nr:hypothetical protein KRP23_2613 [Phytophthora ramorum]
MVRKRSKITRKGAGQDKMAKKPKVEKKKSRTFTCTCGATFATKGERKRHGCKYLLAQRLESELKSTTSPGSECEECGRLYSMDDVLYQDKNVIMRVPDTTTVCSDCAEQDDYPRKEKPVLYTEEIDEYL